jgi:thiol-disulfide isomerase/thioredoxin
MKNTLLLFLVGLSLSVKSQTKTGLQVGEKAPQILVSDWIENAPKDKSFANKFIVLEFWTTWCGPCLASVPHLNQLQNEFKAQSDLIFVSMTNEKVEKVQKLLKRVPFQSAVVTDVTNQTQKNYSEHGDGLVGLPSTILIDKNNVIRWVGIPTELTKKVLSDFVNNQLNSHKQMVVVDDTNATPTGVISKESMKKMLENASSNKVFDMTDAGKVEYAMTSANFAKGVFLNTKISLSTLLSQLCGVSENMVVVPKEYKDLFYKVSYKNNLLSDEAVVRKSILDSVLTYLKLNHSTKNRNSEVYVLKLQANAKLEVSKEEFSSESQEDKVLVFSNMPLKRVVERLGSEMNLVFLNETQFNDNTDILLNTTSIETIEKSLKSYNILLEKGTKELTFHVFEQ